MQPTMKSTHDRQPLPLAASLLITSGVFINACLVAEMFHLDTRWLLGRETLGTAARDAIICAALFLVISVALLFSGSLKFREKFGWRAYFQSAFLLVSSLLLIALGLLAQSRAFVQYFTGGVFTLHGMPFFLWALLPFTGFLLLCRLLDTGSSTKRPPASASNTGVN